MAIVNFTKMQGAGNDFIMIDNRKFHFSESEKSDLAAKLCPRALAVGADGMIFLENDSEYDAKWDFYNADGTSAEMCGNGARCFAVFAERAGVFKEKFIFRTIAGAIEAELTAPDRVRVKLTDAPLVEKICGLSYAGITSDIYFINTGVPHVVVAVDDINEVDIAKLGSAIRYHNNFAPAGTNANFISKYENGIAIRTYERGVEAETLACGTGAVAGAIVASLEYDLTPPVIVKTKSGDILNISYAASDNCNKDVFLEGPAEEVYRGTVNF